MTCPQYFTISNSLILWVAARGSMWPLQIYYSTLFCRVELWRVKLEIQGMDTQNISNWWLCITCINSFKQISILGQYHGNIYIYVKFERQSLGFQVFWFPGGQVGHSPSQEVHKRRVAKGGVRDGTCLNHLQVVPAKFLTCATQLPAVPSPPSTRICLRCTLFLEHVSVCWVQKKYIVWTKIRLAGWDLWNPVIGDSIYTYNHIYVRVLYTMCICQWHYWGSLEWVNLGYKVSMVHCRKVHQASSKSKIKGFSVWSIIQEYVGMI